MISTGSISVIVPVLHEEDRILGHIRHLRDQKGGRNVQIIVVDGDEDGSTLNCIQDHDIVKITSKKGRGAQMNDGEDHASGDILLFLHADTYLPDRGFELILQTLEDERISAGAFDLKFDRVDPVIRSITFLNDLRARITRTPYGDQAIFIRRSVFDRMGGYRPIMLFEDADLMRRLRGERMRIHILKEKVTTSGRRFNERGAFRRLFRNIILILLYNLGVDPDRLARYY